MQAQQALAQERQHCVMLQQELLATRDSLAARSAELHGLAELAQTFSEELVQVGCCNHHVNHTMHALLYVAIAGMHAML